MKTKLLKATWFLLQWCEFDFHKPIWFGRNSYLHYEKYKNTGGGKSKYSPWAWCFSSYILSERVTILLFSLQNFEAIFLGSGSS